MNSEGILSGYNDVLLPEDVQKILQTGRNTVYTYLAEGKIKSIRILFNEISQLNSYIYFNIIIKKYVIYIYHYYIYQ